MKDPEIRSFNDLSKSTKRRYVLQLARQIYDEVEQNKENLFYSKDNIRIKQIRFEINEKKYNVNYGKFDKDNDIKLKYVVVKSLDRERISRDAYRSLIDINQHLPLQKNIPISLVNIYQSTTFEPISGQSHFTEPEIIQNVMDYIEKSEQRRITDILNYIVPKYIKQDGRNVGRKVKYVMITITLLNNIERLHKLESHYTLVLYLSSESYKSLYNSLVPLVSDLQNLKENEFHQIANSNYYQGKLDSNEKLIGNWTITKNISNIKQNFLQIQGHISIQWLEYFLTLSKGRPHQNFIKGLYRSTDCTLYIHILVYHVPEFLNLHQNLDSNHENSKKSSIFEILEYEN
ncbi:hypothetical protein Glove_295g2 [Diversispora epigaea]|uniref:Uncharacterized protein n=1 Tax=Diversispora epigaea TaxID=1348612 RepID=A0A397HYM8_9GLOM|nr:hypothetical protein Glove_295g2 [Diversispora epigaea]